ncbi:MAG: TonB-dependent receptor plug domain-containing protein [Leptospirales bacterium]|nr:TonB-dependent receptor plug domain-containing protein [Leptospirales bacterium]
MWLASLGLLLALPGLALAEDSTLTDPVEVTAPRSDDDPQLRSSAATVIETDQVRRAHASLGEALDGQAGLRVRRYGGEGAYETLSIRGANPNQVNFYIDGIPLNNAVSGEVNLADFNLDAFERVEVFRGGEYPGSPIGGAVNLVTRHAGGVSGGRLRAEGGSFGSYALAGGAWGGETLRYAASARVARSDQDYPFHNDNGTPNLNYFDDFEDQRRNAGYRSLYATINLGFDALGAQWTALNDLSYRKNGAPGPASAQTTAANLASFRNTSGLAADWRGLGLEALRLQSRLYYTEYQTDFEDPQQEIAGPGGGSEARLQHFGWIVEPWLYLPEYYQTIKLYLSIEREIYHADQRNRYDQRLQKFPTRTRHTSLARLEDLFEFFNARLRLTPAYEWRRTLDRFQDAAQNIRNLNPIGAERRKLEYDSLRLGAALALWRGEALRVELRGAAERGRRMPLFLELFGERGSILGNATLRPEQSRSAELGPFVQWQQSLWLAELSVAAFHRSVRDLILLTPNSQFSLRAENVDAADFRGLESSLRIERKESFRFYANYTYQRAINASSVAYLRGKYLPLRPLHELQSGLTLLPSPFEITLEATFVGAVYRDRTNEPFSYLPGRWIYNFVLGWSILGAAQEKEELLANFEVRNVQNTRVADLVNYPLPGRSYYASLQYRF